DANDRGAAAAAGLALPIVDVEARGVAACAVVALRVCQGLFEDRANRPGDGGELVPVQIRGRRGGVDARAPERFTRVDVSHAGGHGLIEQCGLDGPTPPSESSSERGRREGARQWIWPERRERKRIGR